MSVIDLRVETPATEKAYDELMQDLPGAQVVVEGSYSSADGAVTVRCFGSADFVKFAIENQGYGTVLSETVVAP